MRRLDEGYTADVDQIEKDEWHRHLSGFRDATFFQTWSFGACSVGEKHLSHVVLRKEGVVVGLAQARINKIPGFPLGIAYISQGPVCRAQSGGPDEQHLRNILRALRAEYVIRRKLFLRVIPQLLDVGSEAHVRRVYAEEGYSWGAPEGLNVIIDLSPPLDWLKQNMHPKWRQSLRAAERNDPKIVEGSDPEIGRLALRIVREMKDRKQFFGGNQEKILVTQADLPEFLKLRIAVCIDGQEPMAALGWITFGTIGIPLIGATGDKALRTKSSYVLWWKMIEFYKGRGFAAVDLGAVNRSRNPGGYLFKTRILGKGPEEGTQYIGHFDAYAGSHLKYLFGGLFQAREVFRDLRSRIKIRKAMSQIPARLSPPRRNP